MAYAPATMLAGAQRVEAAFASAVFSGIVGAANSYGYHVSANDLIAHGKRDDYSLQLVGDRPGDGYDMDESTAVDMSLGPADMILVTTRVYNSWRDANDDRLNFFREVIGTLDGTNVIYMDCQDGSRSTADDSHRWHIHRGGLRVNANRQLAEDAWYSVVTGESYAAWQARQSTNPSPMPTGDDMSQQAESILLGLAEGLPRFTDANGVSQVNCPVQWEIDRTKREKALADAVAALSAKVDALARTPAAAIDYDKLAAAIVAHGGAGLTAKKLADAERAAAVVLEAP